MISHEHKIIFIHIPKCAGSSIEKYFRAKWFSWKEPNYDYLLGWCPKRKIHLQHATAQQMLEMELVDEQTWNSYYKFAFVRNPWDRAYSDYFWLMKDLKVKDIFKNYLLKKGQFKHFLTDPSIKEYRGDHLIPQIDFINVNNSIAVDFIGRFESFQNDFNELKFRLGLEKEMLLHEKQSKKLFSHYSHFYNQRSKKLVAEIYLDDISAFEYKFDDRRKDLGFLKEHLLRFSMI